MRHAVPAPLAVQLRGEEVESLHLGHLVVLDRAGNVLFSRGEPGARVYARSAVKPIQVLPLLLSGAAEAYGLPDEALAIAMASHSGEAAHRAAVQTLLDHAGLDADQLQCGIHVPYGDPFQREPDVLHCNCSGKHAGMLAVCKHQGWDLATYREVEHPLQRWIRDLLAEYADVPAETIGHAVDGCGLPVWRLPLQGLARAFVRLDGKVARLMAAHPHLIAGSGRLDTDLMKAANGLVCKIGGEAVHAGAYNGLGWAIKVADGNKRALGPALARALAEVGHPLPDCPHLEPEVYNNRRELVGRIVAAW